MTGSEVLEVCAGMLATVEQLMISRIRKFWNNLMQERSVSSGMVQGSSNKD
jgi:hypothetical protein